MHSNTELKTKTMERKENIYLEIVEYSTGRVSKRFDMTGKSEREFDKLDRGINRQLDHERFYTRENTTNTELKI